MGATATPAGRLEAIRRVDWRFLLPEAAFGTVLVHGRADGALLAGLELVARSVAVSPGRTGEGGRPDLVVTIGPDDGAVRAAIGQVPDGGWIYIGSGAGRTGQRASLRQVARAAQHGGLVVIRRSWHWPSEPSALEIVPLDDAGAIRFALDRRRSGRAARLKAALAGVAGRLGVLDTIVPGWSVVARRPDAGVIGNGRDTTVDSVRAHLPRDADSAVVLLTPRFRASRHVIGLALRADSGGLAAVIKLPRLADDDGGIRREGAALARAAAAGVRGVPAVLALDGPPRPVLVESALDGVVIGSRDVRARPTELLGEVEAWTRTLAGPADRSHVPFRALFAPALERIAVAVGADEPADILDASPGSDELSPRAIARLATRTAAILDPFGDVALPVVLEHGDLAPPNLLRLRDGGLGAVDWEVADVDGLPLGDLLFFAAFTAGSLAVGADDAPPAGSLTLAEAAIVRQAADLGIDPTLVPALTLAMWARWADRQLARFADGSTPLVERLPARHVRSWDAAVARLDAPR